MPGTVLIVDDEIKLARLLAEILGKEGYQVVTADRAAAAREQMLRTVPDVVLMDIKLPDADGSALMAELKAEYAGTHFIIITAYGSIRSAVESTRHGAVDYLTKPFEPAEVTRAVKRALEGQMLRDEVRRLRGGKRPPRNGEQHAWRSQAMQEVCAVARKAARQDGIVLLLGESGTGKDHMARWIHGESRRSEGPYFALNCAALSRELAESELFGHEPGAFTGTRGRKRGLLELAESGTLLLNEIGELDLGLQAKLLSFLDTRSFVRVGGDRHIEVNARILAATNRDLEQEVENRQFRRDLYYRLNVLPLTLPPLRQRLEDLPQLVESLLDRLTDDLALSRRPTIDQEEMSALQRYHWPGNIRELRNVLERTIILSDGHPLRFKQLALPKTGEWKLEVSLDSGHNLHEITQQVASSLVAEALRRSETKREAAEKLGISRHALAHQMRTLGIKG